VRLLLTAIVAAEGGTSIVPSGIVAFRRHGVVLGKAKLKNGIASLLLGRRASHTGRVVAAFQGSSRFRPSSSPAVPL
jgi:hypothetical protein